MIPIRIYLKGFMSYRNATTISFDGASLWVLAGPNGAGKSAVFDAMTFALYGEHRGGKQFANELIHHECDSMTVKFDFLVDGIEYRVERMVTGKGTPKREARRLTRSADGKPVPGEVVAEGAEELRDWVKTTIGLDYEAFIATVLLQQGRSERLLQAKAKERYEVLAELVDMEPYQALYNKVDGKRKAFEQEVKWLQQQLDGMQEVSDQDLEAARSAVEQAETERGDAQSEVDRLHELVVRSEEWTKLVAELAGEERKLRRYAELQGDFERWLDLHRLLPVAHLVAEQNARLRGFGQREAEALGRGAGSGAKHETPEGGRCEGGPDAVLAVELAGVRAAQIEIERSVQLLCRLVPEQWREEARAADDIQVEGWEAEYARLCGPALDAEGLENMRARQDTSREQAERLKASIEEIPAEARRPAEELREALRKARDRREDAAEAWEEARQRSRSLQEPRAQREDVVSRRAAADRNRHLYSLLAKHLGREGLQLHLLRQAEVSLVEYANEVLDALSGGNIRLELAGEAVGNGGSGDRGRVGMQERGVLDLLVYNYEIGDQPTKVEFASGSQRFRIAVSLALAIGQYMGQGARRIESVIIDEGFGSLDKSGRDAMIEELKGLQKHLGKIILVSHEEEFAGAFPDGYDIEITDGASKVSRREKE